MKTLKALISRYFSRKALPYWGILGIDCMFVLIGTLLAFLIHHGIDEAITTSESLLGGMSVVLFCYIVGFRIKHTYSGVIRFSSFTDLLRIATAVLIATCLIALVQAALVWKGVDFALHVADVIVTGLFAIVFMWITRIFVKALYEGVIHSGKSEGVFIIGIKEGGVAIAKSINSSADMQYEVKGFVTDDSNMANRVLMGHKVYPFDSRLTERMHAAGVHILIVSPKMMNTIRIHNDLVDKLLTAGIRLLVIPDAVNWDGKSEFSVSEFTPIDIEDLLPRDKIEMDMHACCEMLRGNAVMITGAAGSIGSEIVRQVASYSPGLLLLIDQSETPMHDIRMMMHSRWPAIAVETIVGDITDAKLMENIFDKFRPRYVFHAAAYKHVPMMEDNPYQAVINNVKGTKVIADLAVKYGIDKFVMVSTDKAVNPTNVMGCSKRICEIYVQSLDKALKEGAVDGHTQFVTTRFGNVLGSNGSVIPIFQEQIRKGGPVTVTHPDIIRFFMLIPEACSLVIQAGTMGHGGEIYVFDMGEPVRIVDLARHMIRLSGRNDIEITFTGLRDGEKLYEEVICNEEVSLPTVHPKIMVAKVRDYPFAEISYDISEMITAAGDETDMEIVRRMKQIVPEFKSRHSKYEAID